MFDRVASSVIVVAGAAAAAVLAVFAAGFALYAWLEPLIGVPGAAAIVALAAALGIGLFAFLAAQRTRQQELETLRAAEATQSTLLNALPPELGEFARGRPLLALGATALAGLLAARNPRLIRDIIAIIARR